MPNLQAIADGADLMTVHHAELKDLSEIMSIYAGARKFMAEHGNPRQWGGTNWPPENLIRQDIMDGKSYICEQNGVIAAVFYYDFGHAIEPTYATINGACIGSEHYGVVHRIASSGKVKGAGVFYINWVYAQCGHLRMDTHPDNVVMQKLLTKLGFVKTGEIHVVEDNDPRFAYEKL